MGLSKDYYQPVAQLPKYADSTFLTYAAISVTLPSHTMPCTIPHREMTWQTSTTVFVGQSGLEEKMK